MNSQRQNKGVVVCVGPRAAEEGAKVLEAGGNAFDAAVTTAFVQMVVLPFACGVGGMASAHLWKADTRGHQVIDGCLRAGSLVTRRHVGRGLQGHDPVYRREPVRGLPQRHRLHVRLHSRHGGGVRRDAPSALQHALVRPAATGHRHRASWLRFSFPRRPPKYRSLPGLTRRTRSQGYTPVPTPLACTSAPSPRRASRLSRTPSTHALSNDWAAFGAEDFYRGELASAMAEDLSKNGSFVTLEDIRAYKATSYTPRYADYGDYRVYTNASPGGGPLLAEALNVLDGVDLTSLDHGDVEYISRVASTLQLVQQDRRDYLGDPEAIGQESEDVLWSTERAATLRKGVLEGVVGQWPPESESPDTTHMTAVDADGNIACITHSLGSSSNVITPGLGFVYNDGMNRFDPRPGRASSIAPRKARLHMMMPSIAFRDGEPEMAVGAPGGNKILSALAQVIANVADRGMTAVEAVSAPRIHAEGSTVWCEARTRADTCDSLSERGYDVVHETQAYAARASAQLVILGPDGHLDGGSDPRSEGAVVYARK